MRSERGLLTYEAGCDDKVLALCQAAVGSLYVPFAFGWLKLGAGDYGIE